MKFEVYCDEANPDILNSSAPRVKYLMIGSLWLPVKMREEVKQQIKVLRSRHKVWGEIKWSKVAPNRQDFYIELIDLFLSYGKDLRFRCIAVNNEELNLELHNNDEELGFYKFYYQLLHHWILDFNTYSIFCDTKTNRDLKRLQVLARCLSRSNLSSRIANIQSLPSQELVLMQLCDLLLGAASSRINNTLHESTAKSSVVHRIESALDRSLMATPKNEEKFNIFRIQLQGGW